MDAASILGAAARADRARCGGSAPARHVIPRSEERGSSGLSRDTPGFVEQDREPLRLGRFAEEPQSPLGLGVDSLCLEDPQGLLCQGLHLGQAAFRPEKHGELQGHLREVVGRSRARGMPIAPAPMRPPPLRWPPKPEIDPAPEPEHPHEVQLVSKNGRQLHDLRHRGLGFQEAAELAEDYDQVEPEPPTEAWDPLMALQKWPEPPEVPRGRARAPRSVPG